MAVKFYRELLKEVAEGRRSVDDALNQMREGAIDDLGFARVDHRRTMMQGFPEVIYCLGKTPAQSAAIFAKLKDRADGNVLATRADAATADAIQAVAPEAQYDPVSRTVRWIGDESEPIGHVAVVSAGTSDLAVAEEAVITAETMGARVTRVYDAGVAGLHRLLARLDDIRSANTVVVVAGMEGALASVVGGLVQAPVVAVPTSVGYGANFGGLSALLSMLNSCASGVSVVNIDNGFGGGYMAAMINRLAVRGQAGSGEPSADRSSPDATEG